MASNFASIVAKAFPSILGARDGDRSVSAMVVGLGRFGSALARTAQQMGCDVLGVDRNMDIVQRYSTELTHVLQADTTTAESLVKLGATDFDVVVVCIGVDLEASILTTSALVDLEHPNIWVKATTEAQGRILERLGAHHIVYPEQDMGVRVAHAVTGRMLDYFALDVDFALAETRPPSDIVGKTLAESGLRDRYGITVVCIKPEGGSFTYAQAETIVGAGDLLLVAGSEDDIEGFTFSY